MNKHQIYKINVKLQIWFELKQASKQKWKQKEKQTKLQYNQCFFIKFKLIKLVTWILNNLCRIIYIYKDLQEIVICGIINYNLLIKKLSIIQKIAKQQLKNQLFDIYKILDCSTKLFL